MTQGQWSAIAPPVKRPWRNAEPSLKTLERQAPHPEAVQFVTLVYLILILSRTLR
jgi:hypothetical protein